MMLEIRWNLCCLESLGWKSMLKIHVTYMEICGIYGNPCWNSVGNIKNVLEIRRRDFCLAFPVMERDGIAGVKLRYDEDMMSVDSSVT